MSKKQTMFGELEKLPRKPGARVLEKRGSEKWVTIHYSGVVYGDETDEQEMNRVLMEARWHLKKNWGKRGNPIYGDGLMYDYVVFKSGLIVQTRREQQKLWHCRNVTGNSESWSVHVMTGPGEPLTKEQKHALFTLIDELRERTQIPRDHVVGHCEWPAYKGLPVVTKKYGVLPGQSECPGSKVMAAVFAYRKLEEKVPEAPVDQKWVYIVDTDVTVKTAPTDDAKNAVYAATEPRSRYVKVRLTEGTVIALDDITDGWGHIDTGIGFVPMSALKEV